jgi:hypothetical protein
MSTLNVSNITDGVDTVGTSYVVNGSAKAWVNFDQSTGLTVKDSFNISSSTDYAGAKSYHNLTNSHSSIYFTTAGQASSNQTDSGYIEAEAYAKDAGSFWVYVHWQLTAYDRQWVCSTTFGDLA